MSTPKLYEHSNLKAVVEEIAAEIHQLKKDISEAEKDHQQDESLAIENAALRRDTEALRPQFAAAVAKDLRRREKRDLARKTEILTKDLESLKKSREKPAKKP